MARSGLAQFIFNNIILEKKQKNLKIFQRSFQKMFLF